MKKRLISFFLCIIFIFCFPCAAFAANNDVSINDGLDALRAQFSRDKGPKTNSYAIDYSYFSPVKSSDDTTKYPLIIIMAGAREGAYEGKELLANEFAYWSGTEYQARFVQSGGAFILIARAPEEKLLFWDSSKLVSPLKAAIDDFIQKHPNVDKNRIYAMGWCLGAKGAVNLGVNYPRFFSAIVVMVPPFVISEEEAEALAGTPVWLFGSKTDSYASYTLFIQPSWKRICKYSANPEDDLFTSFDTAVDTTYFVSHNVWLQVSHDMQYTGEGYSGMKTVDGSGKTISTENGFITILSKYGLPTHTLVTSENSQCSCLCHSNNIFYKLIWQVKAAVMFCLYASKNPECACGALHWKKI